MLVKHSQGYRIGQTTPSIVKGEEVLRRPQERLEGTYRCERVGPEAYFFWIASVSLWPSNLLSLSWLPGEGFETKETLSSNPSAVDCEITTRQNFSFDRNIAGERGKQKKMKHDVFLLLVRSRLLLLLILPPPVVNQ